MWPWAIETIILLAAVPSPITTQSKAPLRENSRRLLTQNEPKWTETPRFRLFSKPSQRDLQLIAGRWLRFTTLHPRTSVLQKRPDLLLGWRRRKDPLQGRPWCHKYTGIAHYKWISSSSSCSGNLSKCSGKDWAVKRIAMIFVLFYHRWLQKDSRINRSCQITM